MNVWYKQLGAHAVPRIQEQEIKETVTEQLHSVRADQKLPRNRDNKNPRNRENKNTRKQG